MTRATTNDIRITLGAVVRVLASEEGEDATIGAHECLLEVAKDTLWDKDLGMADVQRVGRAVIRQEVIGHLTNALDSLSVLNAPLTSSSTLPPLSPHTCTTSRRLLKVALIQQENAETARLIQRMGDERCVFWIRRDEVDAKGRPLENKHERCGICTACRGTGSKRFQATTHI